MKDVYADFDKLRKGAGINGFKGKVVKRNYAFGEPDVPTGEHQWMKVVYPFSGAYSLPGIIILKPTAIQSLSCLRI